jgi:hypothetical protein
MKKHDICSSIVSLEDETEVLKKELISVTASLRLSSIKENKAELKKLYSQLAKISKLEKQQSL